MHYTSLALKQEKNNKVKARRSTSVFLLLLLLALLFPFLNDSFDRDKNYAITINFDQPVRVASSKSKGKKASSSTAAKEKKEPTRPKVEETQKLQTQKVKQIDFKPTPPIKNAPMPAPIQVPDFQKPEETEIEPIEEIIEIDDSQVELEEIPEPEIEVEPDPEPEINIDDIISEVLEEEAVAEAEEATRAQEAGGDGSGTGKNNSDDGSGKSNSGGPSGGSGDANSGDGKADAGDGAGLDGEGFEGDGILSRQPVEKCDFLQLAVQEGKVVFDICITRAGVPTYIKYSRDDSSIRDMAFVRDLQLCFEDFRFEKDYDAPKNECGKYSFNFAFETRNVNN